MEPVAERHYKDGEIVLDGEIYIQEYVQERVWGGDEWELYADLIPGKNDVKHYAEGDVPLELVMPGRYGIQMHREGDGFAFDLYNPDSEILDKIPGDKSGVTTIKQGVRKLIRFANYLSPKPVLRA